MTQKGVSRSTVVRPGTADAYWLITELLEPQLATPAMDIVHVTSAPKAGPPPHRHSREDELFYIIDGKFDLVINDTRMTAGPGEAVFLPRGSIHTYSNAGSEAARLLVTTAPGGFTKFVSTTGDICLNRGQLPRVGPATFEKLAAGCGRAGIELLPAHRAEKAAPAQPKPREVWCLGLHIRLTLISEQTNDQFSVAEITAAPGCFVPPHTHEREDEFFYVLDGEFEFGLAEGAITAGPGTFIHVPKQTAHGFRNVSNKPARLIDYHAPGGFDRFFVESGTPCDDVKLGPPTEPPDMPRFFEICREHGMEIVG